VNTVSNFFSLSIHGQEILSKIISENFQKFPISGACLKVF
jgi:hypothetical protein